MEDVVQAYLEMSKISILPLRSWSLIHEALTCACVLALLQTTPAGSLDTPLSKMQQLLEKELQSNTSESRLGTVGFVSRGLRLLTFLRENGAEISGAATFSQESVIERPHMASSGAEQAHATVDTVDDQTWWDPFLLDIGLDSSLSSFLDLSSDFFQ